MWVHALSAVPGVCSGYIRILRMKTSSTLAHSKKFATYFKEEKKMNEQDLLNPQIPARNGCLTPKKKMITGSICLVVGSVLVGASIWHESDDRFLFSLSKGVEDTLIATGTLSFGAGAFLIYQGIKEFFCVRELPVHSTTLDNYGRGSSRFHRWQAHELPMGLADDLESVDLESAEGTSSDPSPQ
jgi:hypothetical protein